MEIGLLFSLILIAVLIVLSALFSASETALTGVSKARLHSLEKDGNARAVMVNKILERKDRMIGAMLLGNNFINTLASAIMTSAFIALFGTAGVVYATFVVTILVLIFAEVLPKTYALHHTEELAMRMAPLMRAVIFIFSPVTETVAWIVRFVLKIFGVDISRVSGGSHLELLRGAIEMHDGPEKETAEQRAMLRSILDLFDVFIEDIMIHRKNVTMIDGDQPIDKIVSDILSSPYTRLPVWRGDQDNIIGVIHVKRLLKIMNDHQGSAADIRIEDVLAEPWFVPETTSLFDQLQAFRARREHFAIVVDEYGSFMGIVTLEDILEEIVGEIDDEQDITVPGVRRAHDGSYLIDGSVTIRDLNREFAWDLPDEEYSTLAGLVLYEAQLIPEVGQSFIFHDCRFDVVRRHRNQITMIRVRPLHLLANA
jgi:Mg2+/Co2+ transporter CorB